MKTLLVTGGLGFIGSNFILRQLRESDDHIVNLDLMTYAGNPLNLESVVDHPRHTFVHGSILDRPLLSRLFNEHAPDAVVNFAAESHVDRSIVGPDDFIQTNIVGTFALLQESRRYWEALDKLKREHFRFLHVSTDEVFGSLGLDDPPFTEQSPYAPNSPYSASKAASDHLVRAYHHTYGMPTMITNCSNNYGPRQFPEKLIPLMLLNGLEGKPLPVYGDGRNVRDWLYVDDHCAALALVLNRGQPSRMYNIGGRCEKDNLEVVKTICGLLDEISPDSPFRPHESLVTFVKDRPGHDRRYAIDCSKIESEIGWRAETDFETGIRKTIGWYLDNRAWVESIRTGAYREWVRSHYGLS